MYTVPSAAVAGSKEMQRVARDLRLVATALRGDETMRVWSMTRKQGVREGWRENLAAAGIAGALATGTPAPAQAQAAAVADPIVATLQIDGEIRRLDLSSKGFQDVREAERWLADFMRARGIQGWQGKIERGTPGTGRYQRVTIQGAGGLDERQQGVQEGTDDVKKRMSKLEALALAANRAGDDAKCKMYQQKIQSLKQKLSQSMSESLKPGEYHIHTVYFKDGTKKRIRVTSDEFDVVGYYKQRGQAVDRVDYDYQIHSDMTEAEKEPTTRQELLNRVDKIQRMMTQERNPANLQILRKELEMLKQRYQHLKEDSDSGEAVEMAIMRRMLVAHTDLIIEFGLDKVVDAIEEVAYNVGDVDEIGSSDVSGWVNQVRQILGADA
jgi:hypothetical protein